MSAPVVISDFLPARCEASPRALLPDPIVEPTVSVEQAAKILGVSRGLAYQAVHHDQLPAIRIGRRLRVPTAPLLRLIGSDPATDPRPVEEDLAPRGAAGRATVGEDPFPAASADLPPGWPQRHRGLGR